MVRPESSWPRPSHCRWCRPGPHSRRLEPRAGGLAAGPICRARSCRPGQAPLGCSWASKSQDHEWCDRALVLDAVVVVRELGVRGAGGHEPTVVDRHLAVVAQHADLRRAGRCSAGCRRPTASQCQDEKTGHEQQLARGAQRRVSVVKWPWSSLYVTRMSFAMPLRVIVQSLTPPACFGALSHVAVTVSGA